MARPQGKHREFGINWSMATLHYYFSNTLDYKLNLDKEFIVLTRVTPKSFALKIVVSVLHVEGIIFSLFPWYERTLLGDVFRGQERLANNVTRCRNSRCPPQCETDSETFKVLKGNVS